MTGTTIATPQSPGNNYLDCLALYDFEEDPLSCLLCITSDTASQIWDWIYNAESKDKPNRNIRRNKTYPAESIEKNDIPHSARRYASQEIGSDPSSNSIDYVKLHMALIESLFLDQKQQNLSRSSTIRRKNRKRVADHIAELSLPTIGDPSSFLSKDCRLQKDKGQGDHPGSNICAYGRDATLKKVSEKIELIVKANNATVNKGRAKLTNIQPMETRSILSVKMGFLSINYGILLQWNGGNRGEALVNLVVLRKMVPNSFMNVQYQNRSEQLNVDRLAMMFCQGWCNVNTTADDLSFSKSFPEVDNIHLTADSEVRDVAEHNIQSTPRINLNPSRSGNKSTSLILRDIVDDTNTAILESLHSDEIDDGCHGPNTEVTSLQPPYNIPKPTFTASSQLFVTIQCIRDLQLHPIFSNRKKMKKVSVYLRLSLGNDSYLTKKSKLSSLISIETEALHSKSISKKSYLDNYFKFTAASGTNPEFKIEVFGVRGRLRRTQLLAELILPVTTIEQYFIHSHADPTLVPLQLKLPLSWCGIPKEGTTQISKQKAVITFSIMYDNALYRWIKQELGMVLSSKQHRLFLPAKQC